MSLESWFYGLTDDQQNTLMFLAVLAALLSVSFVIYYLVHMDVVITCYQYGSPVPCPVGYP